MRKSSIVVIVILTAALVGIAASASYFLLIKTKNDTTDTSTSSITNTATEHSANTSSSPDEPVRLIFIHHSTGENWLSDYDGTLGLALSENNYFVSDTNYGWGENGIGDRTDIGNWWEWFRGPESETYLTDLYQESGQNSDYTRLDAAPTGENEIIMFKSCFPNSNLSGSTTGTIPQISSNPLVGESSDSEHHTVANAKGIYIDLLEYFETRQDKLFIVVTAPPLGRNNTTAENASNAREFNDWLVNDWLDDYDHSNVAVFNFYHVLTNYGESNYLEFPTNDWDDHPSTEGNLMATDEFILFINEAYAGWKSQ